MATAELTDPYRDYNFKLKFGGGDPVAHFTECAGFGFNVQTIRYREAGENTIVRCIPGQIEYTDVMLRWGVTDSPEMWDWLKTVKDGKVERRTLSIIMLGPDRITPAMQWELLACWPNRFTGISFNAMGNSTAIESLTLCYEELKRG